MTTAALPKRRTLSDAITPADVALTALVEAQRPADFRAALVLVSRYSRRHMSAEDVASVAACRLGTHLERWGDDLVKAASLAVYEAAAEMRSLEAAQGACVTVLAGTATDVAEAGAPMGRAEYPAPDDITRWTVTDRLGVLAQSNSDPYAASILSAMRRDGTVSGVARALDMATGGRTAVALKARIDRVIAEAAVTVARGDLAAWEHAYAPTGRVNDGARDLARDTRVPTSGPAGLVVRTRPNGQRWVTLSDRSVCVDDSGVAAVLLGQVGMLSAYADGTAAEVTDAGLLGAWEAGTMRPARRPQGVSVGMRYGAGKVAGDTTPEPRPTVSRKRKRDGGIGGPMIPA